MNVDMMQTEIMKVMFEEAKSFAKEEQPPRFAFLGIKGIDGSASDGKDLSKVHTVYSYYLPALNNAVAGHRTTGGVALGNLHCIIAMNEGYPNLIAKMTAQGKASIDEVKLFLRSNGETIGTVTLSKGTDTSVWPAEVDLLTLRNKNNHPLLYCQFCYDVIEYAVGNTKYKYSMAQNAQQ
jgi:hypothetical protein